MKWQKKSQLNLKADAHLCCNGFKKQTAKAQERFHLKDDWPQLVNPFIHNVKQE